MSLGLYGKCFLESEDREVTLYSYYGENWNIDRTLTKELDQKLGSFILCKALISKAEIYLVRPKANKNCKKRIEKRILTQPLYHDGALEIIEYCGADQWAIDTNYVFGPRIVRNLVNHICERYQLEDKMPEVEEFIQ